MSKENVFIINNYLLNFLKMNMTQLKIIFIVEGWFCISRIALDIFIYKCVLVILILKKDVLLSFRNICTIFICLKSVDNFFFYVI